MRRDTQGVDTHSAGSQVGGQQSTLAPEDRCQITNCYKPADYEGWARNHDFAGISTGLIVRLRVCEDHLPALKGDKDQGVTGA